MTDGILNSVLGALTAFIGLLTALVPLVQKWWEKRAERKSQQEGHTARAPRQVNLTLLLVGLLAVLLGAAIALWPGSGDTNPQAVTGSTPAPAAGDSSPMPSLSLMPSLSSTPQPVDIPGQVRPPDAPKPSPSRSSAPACPSGQVGITIDDTENGLSVNSRITVQINLPGVIDSSDKGKVWYFVRNPGGAYFPSYEAPHRTNDNWYLNGVQLGRDGRGLDLGQWSIRAIYLNESDNADFEATFGSWQSGKSSLPAGAQQLKNTVTMERVC